LSFKLPPNAVYAAFVVPYFVYGNNAILRAVTTANCPTLTSTSIYRTIDRKHVSAKQRHAATEARCRQRQRHGREIFRIEAEHDLIISALIEIPDQKPKARQKSKARRKFKALSAV